MSPRPDFRIHGTRQRAGCLPPTGHRSVKLGHDKKWRSERPRSRSPCYPGSRCQQRSRPHETHVTRGANSVTSADGAVVSGPAGDGVIEVTGATSEPTSSPPESCRYIRRSDRRRRSRSRRRYRRRRSCTKRRQRYCSTAGRWTPLAVAATPSRSRFRRQGCRRTWKAHRCPRRRHNPKRPRTRPSTQGPPGRGAEASVHEPSARTYS